MAGIMAPRLTVLTYAALHAVFIYVDGLHCLQYFDAVGWAAERASSL